MTLGEQIRARRVEKGLSLPALALMTNVSIGHLSNVERNIRPLSLRVLRAIREALAVPLDERQDVRPRQVKVSLAEDVADPERGAEHRGEARVAALRRADDGTWSMTLRYDYEFTLPDGRRLRFRGEKSVRGVQVGRRPRRKRA